MRDPIRCAAMCLAILCCWNAARAGNHDGADPALRTRWAHLVDKARVLPEYPRPQMTREHWTNLNGPWSCAIVARGSARPQSWDGDILVPFCPESTLSGVGRTVGPDQELWYRRMFESPPTPRGGRLLLHFGAVDWQSTVFVNGQQVGQHEGGFDPFTFDITAALVPGTNELVVRVWDPTDAGHQPRGKQVREPEGIWYTAVTGIWQTVWLEPVPAASISSLRVTTDVKANTVTITATTRGDAAGLDLILDTRIGGRAHRISGPADAPIVLHPEEPIPTWSPDSPSLHEFTMTLIGPDGAAADRVGSYFGFRSIDVRPDDAGITRLFLNGEPLFHYGTLDQGWWPDGLYTAPTDEALRYDLEITRALGFNMVRKHVKVEPARWYWWCDRMGLLVWQDMPSGDRSIHGDMPDIQRSPESAATFERELHAMIDALYNAPSIVMWVPFNEGWGQWETGRVVDLVRAQDPTRLVDAPSGWTDRGVGDVHDVHVYPGPGRPELETERAAVLGEFGGLGLPEPGHLWNEGGNWGYRTYRTRTELTEAYTRSLRRLHMLIGEGLAAAVYTQTTDVETEVNGLMTYDRAVIKVDTERAAAAAGRLHLPPPEVETILPASAGNRTVWSYTTSEPAADWMTTSFDDVSWPRGTGGFGTEGTPGASIGTRWDGSDIWLRRTFPLTDIPDEVELLVHHDEDAEIYLNGVLVARLRGYETDYMTIPLEAAPNTCLRPGPNLLAIHCHNTTGGQYIDAGLVSLHWNNAP
ncbi:MAG: hypothetical protein KDA21_02610 [Phycisphaerales bacterium]|nr:hypothetical protein [Phycisphaerales bacterium]